MLLAIVVLCLLYELQAVITVPTWMFVFTWIAIGLKTVWFCVSIAGKGKK